MGDADSEIKVSTCHNASLRPTISVAEAMMTSSMPRISVVISSYNFARYLRECIESVLAQTLPPFEIIISDDCSSDDSWIIISEYSQRYPHLIKAYRHKQNIGPPRNGNFSKRQATGDLIAWLDGDDRWLPHMLEVQWKALQENPAAHVAYPNAYTIDASGKRTGIWYNGVGSPPPSGDVFVEVFSRRVFPNTRSVFRNQLLYRSVLEETGYNDLGLRSYWDWDGKIRLTSRFQVVYSGGPLVEYRVHKGGLSRGQPLMHLGGMMDVYEKNLPLLAQRSNAEAARVKCNIESLLAVQQDVIQPTEQIPYYCARSVYDRNRRMLDQLPERERTSLKKEMTREFKYLCLTAARQEAKSGNLKTACEYLRESLQYEPTGFGLKSIARLVLPGWVIARMRAESRQLRSKLQRP